MKLFPFLSLTATAVLCAPVAAQGIVPYLPKDTLMVMSAPDLQKSVAEFQSMPLAKMWAEEEVQSFVADLMVMAKEQMAQLMAEAEAMHEQGALPVDPKQLQNLSLAGGTFAVTRMELAESDFGPMPKFGFVLHLDFGSSAPTWNALIETGLAALDAQADGQMQRTDSKVGDVQMVSLQPNGPPGLEMGLNVAMVPNGVIVGTLAEDVRNIVTNMTSQKATLTGASAYADTMRHVDANGAEMQMFMRIDPWMDLLLQGLRIAAENEPDMAVLDIDGVARAMQAMGLRQLGAIGMTSSYVDGKSISRAFHAHDSAEQTSTANRAVDMSFLRWVPKDAVSFGAGAVDAASLYDTVIAGLQAYDPDFATKMMERLSQFESQLGFSIRGDLFGSLGDHYITWSMPVATLSGTPEMAVLMKVQDEQKLVKSMRGLAALSNGLVEIEEGEKRGLKVYQVVVNADASGGMGMNPLEMFQPTFAFKNGYMVMAFSASDVKRVFQRMDRTEADDAKGDIRGNKEFAAVAKQIPAGVTSVSFTDWKAQFESLYQLATGVLAFMPMSEDVPLDMALLPDSASLTQHLFGGVSYSRTTAAGDETVTVGPFGAETWLMAGFLAGAGAAFLGGAERGF